MNEPKYPRPLDDDVARWADTLNEGDREWFEERAAIIEFDSHGISRRDAERAAMAETQAHLQRDCTSALPTPAGQNSRK